MEKNQFDSSVNYMYKLFGYVCKIVNTYYIYIVFNVHVKNSIKCDLLHICLVRFADFICSFQYVSSQFLILKSLLPSFCVHF